MTILGFFVSARHDLAWWIVAAYMLALSALELCVLRAAVGIFSALTLYRRTGIKMALRPLSELSSLPQRRVSLLERFASELARAIRVKSHMGTSTANDESCSVSHGHTVTVSDSSDDVLHNDGGTK